MLNLCAGYPRIINSLLISNLNFVIWHQERVRHADERSRYVCALARRAALAHFIVLIDKKARYVNVGPRNGAARLTLIALRVRIRPRVACGSRASAMICDIAGNFFLFPIMAGFVSWTRIFRFSTRGSLKECKIASKRLKRFTSAGNQSEKCVVNKIAAFP